jgi:hypothetical protein
LVTASGADRDKKRREAGGASDHWRPPTAAYLPSFVALRDAVNGACEKQTEWEGKVAAGIRAALEFAAADPAAVHALTIDARRQSLGDDNRADEVVRYFAAMLGEVAPAEMRFPVSTDEGAVEAIRIIAVSLIGRGMSTYRLSRLKAAKSRGRLDTWVPVCSH